MKKSLILLHNDKLYINYMKSLQQFIDEKLTVNKKSFIETPTTKDELDEAIMNAIKKGGWNCSLNHIDISSIEDLEGLFSYRGHTIKLLPEFRAKGDNEESTDFCKFDGDISEWDVSNVKNMDIMFYNNKYFSGNISKWDVRNVESMEGMFSGTNRFNCDISDWNMDNVKNVDNMFFSADAFKQDLSKWDFKQIKKRPKNMFTYSPMYRRPNIQPKIFKELDTNSKPRK